MERRRPARSAAFTAFHRPNVAPPSQAPGHSSGQIGSGRAALPRGPDLFLTGRAGFTRTPVQRRKRGRVTDAQQRVPTDPGRAALPRGPDTFPTGRAGFAGTPGAVERTGGDAGRLRTRGSAVLPNRYRAEVLGHRSGHRQCVHSCNPQTTIRFPVDDNYNSLVGGRALADWPEGVATRWGRLPAHD